MKEFQYTVKDACGIHARPAGLLVKTVKGFASTATLEKDGKSCDMRKLMALMGMGVKQGETITIKVEGDDEEAAAAAIQKFLTENVWLCAEAGADFVGTTMRGYTPETQGINDIDFEFVHKLATECPAKIIAEGHIHYPEQAVKALEAGAFALVVGGAITRPAEITARFTGAINAMNK